MAVIVSNTRLYVYMSTAIQNTKRNYSGRCRGVTLHPTKTKLKMNLKKSIKIGIDPGVETGLAVTVNSKLTEVTSLDFWDARERIGGIIDANPGSTITIYVEDAEKRSGTKEAAFGAGQVVAHCKLWKKLEEKLGSDLVSFKFIRPDPSLTKYSKEKFKKFTNWQERTNNHGRDAAMLIYGL